MKTQGARACGLSLSLGLLALAGACGSVEEPAVHTIEIQDMAFQPAVARVSVGDTVIWINRDFVPHTATSTDGTWASPPLAGQESWYWVVEGTGSTSYACDFHPMMEGRLIINDGNLN